MLNYWKLIHTYKHSTSIQFNFDLLTAYHVTVVIRVLFFFHGCLDEVFLTKKKKERFIFWLEFYVGIVPHQYRIRYEYCAILLLLTIDNNENQWTIYRQIINDRRHTRQWVTVCEQPTKASMYEHFTVEMWNSYENWIAVPFSLLFTNQKSILRFLKTPFTSACLKVCFLWQII